MHIAGAEMVELSGGGGFRPVAGGGPLIKGRQKKSTDYWLGKRER